MVRIPVVSPRGLRWIVFLTDCLFGKRTASKVIIREDRLSSYVLSKYRLIKKLYCGRMLDFNYINLILRNTLIPNIKFSVPHGEVLPGFLILLSKNISNRTTFLFQFHCLIKGTTFSFTFLSSEIFSTPRRLIATGRRTRNRIKV